MYKQKTWQTPISYMYQEIEMYEVTHKGLLPLLKNALVSTQYLKFLNVTMKNG